MLGTPVQVRLVRAWSAVPPGFGINVGGFAS
jgi:hypothetical protein